MVSHHKYSFLVVKGPAAATLAIKDELKAAGFRWDADRKEWHLEDDVSAQSEAFVNKLLDRRQAAVGERYQAWCVDSRQGDGTSRPWDDCYVARFPLAFLQIGW